MDYLSLETFIKVAEEKSFSKAAEKLFVTQPAISKRIASLESELGTTLLDRIGKTVEMTHSGEILYERAKDLLETMRNCKTAIKNLNNKVEGTLKLGVSHHIGLHRLPNYLKNYSSLYPDVEIKIHFVDSEDAYRLIQNGDLELALATLSPIKIPHTYQECIWTDPLSFVVSGDHALAKLNNNQLLTLNDLAKHPAILPSSSTYTGQLIKKLFDHESETINTYIETNYLETIKMMVSIGLGWTILPRTMLNKDLRGLNVRSNTISRDLGYILHESRTSSIAAKAFIQTLKQLDYSEIKNNIFAPL